MQENVDINHSLIFSLMGALVVMVLLLAKKFDGEIGQRLNLDSFGRIQKTDTIYTKQSRWYYKGDSTQRPFRITLMSEKAHVPYDVVYIEPDDFLDAELEPGYNVVHIRTVEGYPYIHNKYRIFQVDHTPIPKPKFNIFKLFRE